MIWVRYRFPDGRPAPVVAPLSTCDSATITKGGVAFFQRNGKIGFYYPNDRIAEFTDDKTKYVRTEKKTGEFTHVVWEHREPIRDGVGRVIG